MADFGIIVCTSSALAKLEKLQGEVSCWLHFEEGVAVDLSFVVLKLFEFNSCHFAISGSGAEKIHDAIDDIILSEDGAVEIAARSDMEPLTTWHLGAMSKVAEEVMAVRCPSGNEPTRLVIVFARETEIELERLSEILSLDTLRPLPI